LDFAYEGKGDDNPPFQPSQWQGRKIRIASIGEENQERKEEEKLKVLDVYLYMCIFLTC
jgi:hypothetical protein